MKYSYWSRFGGSTDIVIISPESLMSANVVSFASAPAPESLMDAREASVASFLGSYNELSCDVSCRRVLIASPLGNDKKQAEVVRRPFCCLGWSCGVCIIDCEHLCGRRPVSCDRELWFHHAWPLLMLLAGSMVPGQVLWDHSQRPGGQIH